MIEPAQWITMIALTLFLAEGFALTVFPRQFKEFLIEADPRSLQLLGVVETVVAAGLLTGIVAG